MGNSLKSARFLVESRLRDAARGDAKACFDLGIVYSSGAEGVDVDLVEAHKWFNIAAVSGSASGSGSNRSGTRTAYSHWSSRTPTAPGRAFVAATHSR